jgi:hypothetical protein
MGEVLQVTLGILGKMFFPGWPMEFCCWEHYWAKHQELTWSLLNLEHKSRGLEQDLLAAENLLMSSVH